jgi:PiT family inorganic phosphate transporter
MTLIFLVILAALVFTYINGFHDTANSIATVVATKVLTPRQAVALAAVTNLVGAFVGTAVATTIASGLVDPKIATSEVLICALVAAILWNLLTWWFGMPSSSSHALVGGLCGACLAAAHNDWHALVWSIPNHVHWWKGAGLLWKVIVPMILSPICGLVFGFSLMGLLYFLLRNWRTATVNKTFGKLQLLSSAGMGLGHGMNDAQKTMGIIALALCAGTAVGGWRIIKTLGHKMVRLHPVHGFAAETTGATILLVTAMLGMPVSTTHAVTTSIMGVGCAKGFNHLKFDVVERILWAWIMTLPASGGVAYLLVKLAQVTGWIH